MADAFTVAICDSDQFRLTFAGVQLSYGAGASGYADGEFFKVTQMKPSFTEVEDTDGTVSRSKTNSRLGEAMLRTMQTNSRTNGYLSTMLMFDESNPNGAGVGTLVLQDMNGTTYFKALKAWVIGPPDQSFDRSAKEREWKFHVVRSSVIVGGN